MIYRPEIDGLRAVAVLAVILFHAGLTALSGGFMGVDVFFVISGYLITSILLKDMKEGKFSIVAFYERRARRILPALLFVISVTIVASYFILPPDLFKSMARSAVAAILSFSNILFWREADYFNAAGELKPLLHTWSLGLEEQFYIFFPPILFIVWKYFRKYVGVSLGIGFVISLLLAEYMLLKGHVTGNFYLLPMRGWELLAGAYVAYRETKGNSALSDKGKSALAVLGLSMILASMCALDKTTPHPGLFTLLPVIGTALVIHYGSTGAVKLVLSQGILVGIGVISYSLYLWHQPVFSLFRSYSLDAPGSLQYAILIGVSLVLAVFSYKYIETPFRNRERFSCKFIWWFSGIFSCLLLVVAGSIYLKDGFPQRFSSEYAPIFKAKLSRSEDLLAVGGRHCRDRSFEDSCVIGDTSKKPDWALVGDSHAGTIGVSLDNALKDKERSGLFLVQAGCPYIPQSQALDRKVSCRNFTKKAQEKLLNSDIHNIILMSRYVGNYHRTVFDNQEGGVEAGGGLWDEIGDQDSVTMKAEILKSYVASVQELLDAGKNVYLVYPVPEVGWNVPNEIFKKLKRHQEASITTSEAVYQERSKEVVAAFDSIGKRKNLKRVYPDRILCGGDAQGRCVTELNGDILYFDDDHLTVEGANLLVKRLFKP